MEYERVILELLARVGALEEEVAALKGTKNAAPEAGKSTVRGSKKYRRLTERLSAAAGEPVTLTFQQIESLLGFSLPACARRSRQFWANTETHSFAHSWLCVGYRTMDVSLTAETVVFEK